MPVIVTHGRRRRTRLDRISRHFPWLRQLLSTSVLLSASLVCLWSCLLALDGRTRRSRLPSLAPASSSSRSALSAPAAVDIGCLSAALVCLYSRSLALDGRTRRCSHVSTRRSCPPFRLAPAATDLGSLSASIVCLCSRSLALDGRTRRSRLPSLAPVSSPSLGPRSAFPVQLFPPPVHMIVRMPPSLATDSLTWMGFWSCEDRSGSLYSNVCSTLLQGRRRWRSGRR